MSEKRRVSDIASRRKIRDRPLANARGERKLVAHDLRDDSQLAELVKARRHERRIKVVLDEL